MLSFPAREACSRTREARSLSARAKRAAMCGPREPLQPGVRAESIAWLDLAMTMHMFSKRACFHACMRQPSPPLFSPP